MPSRSSGYLDNQRKYALSRAKIGHCKPLVGHEDAYYTHTREIQAFCDHLRANKDVYFAVAKSEQRIFQIAFGIRGIGIEARMAHVRKSLMQLFFDAFCSVARPC
jgi:hypothetical protein